MQVQQYGSLPGGEDILLYRLENANGMSVEILNWGGVIRSLRVPGRDGTFADVVMGFDTLAEQLQRGGWNCGIVGRCANRLAGGRFYVRGKEYQIDIEPGAPHVLHGGSGNYARKRFCGEADADAEGEKLTLSYHDHGEGGFPGEVQVWVTYVLTPHNELVLRYRALPSADTVFNITSHCYFNLAGHGSGRIDEQVLQLDADYYLPTAAHSLPSGETLSVEGTPFDFRTPRRLGEGLASDHPQILKQNGYDHNLCLSGGGYRRVGYACDPASGRKMELLTDLPGVQLYTSGNEKPGQGCYKDGASYDRFHAFCLETQYFPNATAYSHFPQPVLLANVPFTSQTAFRFSVE
ncbi:MAG: galactose mutarotase [Christensenellaceae bacterium]|jgi:aldose 1-epimerase|nr:galactose mutarotase [Christensenellaceae bacterium]